MEATVSASFFSYIQVLKLYDFSFTSFFSRKVTYVNMSDIYFWSLIVFLYPMNNWNESKKVSQ